MHTVGDQRVPPSGVPHGLGQGSNHDGRGTHRPTQILPNKGHKLLGKEQQKLVGLRIQVKTQWGWQEGKPLCAVEGRKLSWAWATSRPQLPGKDHCRSLLQPRSTGPAWGWDGAGWRPPHPGQQAEGAAGMSGTHSPPENMVTLEEFERWGDHSNNKTQTKLCSRPSWLHPSHSLPGKRPPTSRHKYFLLQSLLRSRNQ